jgi:hypothetical protein
MTRDGILGYLDSTCKTEELDPYNNGLTHITCVEYILCISLNGYIIKTSLTQKIERL